jgi:hypothetical protein
VIAITVKMTPDSVKQITVELSGKVKNLQGLNKALATRLSDELIDHFREKNKVPNKLGGARTNFWSQLAKATSVEAVNEKGATVTVADHRFRIHVTGGTIKPGPGKKALTIPLIPEARGLMAASYVQKFDRPLFTIRGRNALFERTDRGTESLIDKTDVRARQGKRTLTIPLAARSTIRPVYALASSATIPDDPTALPTGDKLQAALLEEAADWLDATLSHSTA